MHTHHNASLVERRQKKCCGHLAHLVWPVFYGFGIPLNFDQASLNFQEKQKDKTGITLTIQGYVFQNIKFCFIKICFETELRYFLVWLFIWIFYYFNSVKFKIASKSVCTRNAALNSHVWWGTICLSFFKFFEACLLYTSDAADE